jgi:hypothetical protein
MLCPHWPITDKMLIESSVISDRSTILQYDSAQKLVGCYWREGSQQVRNVDLAADGSLTLSASDLIPGTQNLRHHRLIWRRE